MSANDSPPGGAAWGSSGVGAIRADQRAQALLLAVELVVASPSRSSMQVLVDLDLETELGGNRRGGFLRAPQWARPEAVDPQACRGCFAASAAWRVAAIGKAVAVGVGEVAAGLGVGDRLAVADEVDDQAAATPLPGDPGVGIFGHRDDLVRQVAADEVGDRDLVERRSGSASAARPRPSGAAPPGPRTRASPAGSSGRWRAGPRPRA